jgi:hypothetical protein
MNEQMHAENPGTNCTSCGTSWYITYAKVPQQICCGRLGIQLHEQGPNPATLSPQTECSAQSNFFLTPWMDVAPITKSGPVVTVQAQSLGQRLPPL